MRCVPKRFLSAFFCDGLRAKPPGFEPPISPSARMGKCSARGGEQSRTWFTLRESFSIRVDLRHQRSTVRLEATDAQPGRITTEAPRAQSKTWNEERKPRGKHGKDLQGIQLFPFRVVFRGSFPPCPLFLRDELGTARPGDHEE